MANRVLIGEHNSLGYGMFISKPGADVLSATKNDLIYNSTTAYGGGQIHTILNITCASSGTYEGTGTITGLGYIPFVQVTEYSGGTTKSIPAWWGRATGGSGCVLEGTMIKTPNGEVPIEDLKTYDTVIGYDLNNNKEVETHIIGQSIHNAERYVEVNGLRITTGHPIWTKQGWSCIDPQEYYQECLMYGGEEPSVTDIRPLQLGDEMLNSTVEEIKSVYSPTHVYNIEVDKFRNYIADNILVHNGGGMGGGGGGGGGGNKGKGQIRWSGFRCQVTSSQVRIFPWLFTASSGETANYVASHHSAGGIYDLEWPPTTSGKTYKVIVYRMKAYG
jgi:hypothetical protein